MAATQTVPQPWRLRKETKQGDSEQTSGRINSVAPRNGVVTLFGYGISVRVDRGHLVYEDGIGSDRRSGRFPRVGHGLRRLVVIGADGMVSLAALRWLADQNASFTILERDGSVLFNTGPVRSSDAKLRRALGKADQNETGLRIARALIAEKLTGQEQVAREKLNDLPAAQSIRKFRASLETAETLTAIRQLESYAGFAYWSAWRGLPITFVKNDVARVPEHWRSFGTRSSQLTGSPRLATNPVNAMLNYLYALLEAETRLAATAVGLDPGLGILHLDTEFRDSLACDLMEPVRPKVDAFVMDWIRGFQLSREWFFEQRNGNCRLMAPFAVRLAETSTNWGQAVAPFAEWVVHTLWAGLGKRTEKNPPATLLTQRLKREAKGGPSLPSLRPLRVGEPVCSICGKTVAKGKLRCSVCTTTFRQDHMQKIAPSGRIATLGPQAQARRRETQRRNYAEAKAWKPWLQPPWLTEQTYTAKIQPRLALLPVSSIASGMGVSRPYASDVRKGFRRPHPRHWQALAELAGVSGHNRL